MLRKLRNAAGLTQRELAKLAGVSQAHIAKIERGSVDPRLSTVNRILQVLTMGKGKKCGDIMAESIISVKPDDKILKVSKLMIGHAISQVPVVKNGKCIGAVTEESIVRNLSSTIADERVTEIMQSPLPSVPENTDTSLVKPLLEHHPALLVIRRGEIVGIITRSDLLKTVS